MQKLILGIVFIVIGLSSPLVAQTTITQWKFNGTDINSIPGGHDTPTPSFGSGSLQLIGGVTAIFAGADGETDPEADATDFALRTLNYPAETTNNKTAGIQFSVSTVGFNSIGLTFDQKLSGTAANTWTVFYTADITAGSPVWVEQQTFTFVPDANSDKWYNQRTVNFSGVTALVDNPNAAFQIVSTFDIGIGKYLAAKSTSTYAGGGNSRFDMLTISGVPLVVTQNEAPVASTVALSGIASIADTLKASYTYSDAEGDQQGTSTYKWYSATDDSGTGETEIIGANGIQYIMAAADLGKYISFEVTPVALTGEPAGDPVKSSYKGVYDFGDPSVIIINELYSRGLDTHPDPTLQADWIEFYNPGIKPVTLARLRICDSGACQTFDVDAYAQLIVPAGGFLSLQEDADHSFTFGLSSNGEFVLLRLGNGVLIDSLGFPALEEAQSFGRFPDGDGEGVKLSPPSREDSNNGSTPELGDPSVLFINEVYSNGVLNNTNDDLKSDWIEFYNPSEVDVTLAGLQLCSGTACETLPSTALYELVVPAGSFLALSKGDLNSFTFELATAGGRVVLKNQNNLQLDSLDFPETEDTETFGRFNDGTENEVVLTPPTKGGSNNTSTPVVPVTGLADEKAMKTKLFPLPANDHVTLEVTETKVIQHVSVFNVTGQEVLSMGANASRAEFSVLPINRGMYFVRITYSTGLLETVKLVKE